MSGRVMRVLVCGGRDFGHGAFAFRTLDWIHLQRPFALVIQGGARGADLLARNWALASGIACDTYEADWALGKKGGPIRNQRMIDEGKPNLVIAFPGGRGTADMVRRAKAAGIEVLEPKP